MNKEQRSIVKKLAGIVMAFILALTTVNSAFATPAKKAPKLNAEEITIVSGKSFNFNINNKIKGSTYKWRVVNKEIATINEKNGVVIGLQKGTTNVFCRIGVGKTSYLLKAKVNVLRPAVRVSISNPVGLLEAGESYRLEADVKPNSSNDYVSWFSSDESVLKVNEEGELIATKPGLATITLSTVSGRKDRLDIRVVPEGKKGEYSELDDYTEDKADENDKANSEDNKDKSKDVKYKDYTITNDDVDLYNEILIIDKTYKNLYIDDSVGDANIYLAGVSIENLLVMNSGNYSLYMYESIVKELRIDELPKEVQSFAIDEDEDEVPNLIIGENTQITDLNAKISASIRQEDGSAIEGLRVTQDENGQITIYLNNYSGGLLLDSSFGDMEIVVTGCNLSSVNVNSNENSGNITLTNAGASAISNLTVSGTTKLNLGIPTNDLNIGVKAQNSNITVLGSVGNIVTNGANGVINVASGGSVDTINLNGEGTSLSGEGTVTEANVNANNCNVDTTNTLVTVGIVDGTIIQGHRVEAGTTINASTPTPSPVQDGGPSPNEGDVTAISIDHETMWLKPAETGTITAVVSSENASNMTVTWTSSNTDIATVKNGIVTAKKAGTVDITATAGGRTALCVVTVESNEEDFEFDNSTGTIISYKGSGETVVIPMTINDVAVEHIGYCAFVRFDYDIYDYISNNISSLILPSGLLDLDYGAFAYSMDLESIFISDSVINIEYDAFQGCSKLREINVDKANSVYSSMDGVLLDKDMTELIIYPPRRQESSFLIPTSLITLAPYIFSGAEKLENINVEEGHSLYSSMDGVLYNKDKTKLISYPEGRPATSYEIPNNTVIIGEYAFSGDKKLKSIRFQEPSQVANIEAYAFAYNIGLETITIPASVTSIGNSAFYLAESLERIDVEEGNTLYADVDGVLFSKDKTILIRYPGGRPATSYEIPSNTVKIDEYAFSRSYNIVSISFEEPSQSTTIDIGAFSNCENLESIVLADSINNIYRYAFYWCDKLTSITIGGGVILDFDLIKNNNNIFRNAYNSGGAGNYTKGADGTWTKATLPITTIASISGKPMVGKELSVGALTPAAASATYQWMSCDAIDGTYSDISGARAGTYTLTAADVGKYIRVRAVGRGDYSGTVTSIALGPVESSENDFVFDSGAGTVTGYVGSGGVVVIPEVIDGVAVVSIGKEAFDKCESLTSINIPKSVKTIDDYAFEECFYLAKVIFDAGSELATIGDCAFYNCVRLTNINIPKSVKSIDDFAFASCFDLAKVIFDAESELVTIGDNAFYNCFSLTSISIPASVEVIEPAAFSGCKGLETIDIDQLNTKFTVVGGVLYNKEKTSILCYPAGKTDILFEIPEGVTTIGDSAFAYCSMLTEVVFPKTLNAIGWGAFEYCNMLTSINIPDGITVGNYALFECTSLESITIGKSVKVGGYLLYFNSNHFQDAYNKGGPGTYRGTYKGEWTKVIFPTAVTVSGSAITYVGDILTAIVTPEDATNITYQWQKSTAIEGVFEDIAEATYATIIISPDLIDKKLRVKIVWADGMELYSSETDEVK